MFHKQSLWYILTACLNVTNKQLGMTFGPARGLRKCDMCNNPGETEHKLLSNKPEYLSLGRVWLHRIYLTRNRTLTLAWQGWWRNSITDCSWITAANLISLGSSFMIGGWNIDSTTDWRIIHKWDFLEFILNISHTLKLGHRRVMLCHMKQ